jgi:hypothetical protein
VRQTADAAYVMYVLSACCCCQVGESRRKVDLLREAAQGGLGLGSGGKAARGQQVNGSTTALAIG